MRLFYICAAGNYIQSTEETPFFQIGETKYGKPILDRLAFFDTTVQDAAKLALISMDSTLRSNLSVLDSCVRGNDEMFASDASVRVLP
ncbi:MAG: hypothetical protein IH626_09940 [Rhodospirillales bacterium]|nr:hypothetical protein [Rhodospirillales bacterium]